MSNYNNSNKQQYNSQRFNKKLYKRRHNNSNCHNNNSQLNKKINSRNKLKLSIKTTVLLEHQKLRLKRYLNLFLRQAIQVHLKIGRIKSILLNFQYLTRISISYKIYHKQNQRNKICNY